MGIGSQLTLCHSAQHWQMTAKFCFTRLRVSHTVVCSAAAVAPRKDTGSALGAMRCDDILMISIDGKPLT